MSVKIIKEQYQAKGAFAGGLILENKPIGFPQDGGNQKPYSNLFYWANAWSDKGGLIGEHPHKFFEIMSFVIEGEIEHYDNKFDRWLPLSKGDAQIIRAGNGITHAEKIKEKSRMFQIWFDPNIQETMSKPASYDDYKSEEMHYFEEDGITYKNYTGNGGPVKMDAEGVVINEIMLPKGEHTLKLNDDKIYSFYLIKGSIMVDKELVAENDFVIIEDENKIDLKVAQESVVFTIANPKKLNHKTYSELVRF
ncbi:MAG: pirin family protein [Flavobacteriales bacterium]|nr:pirin family protein [Flavobacteriales bacterium]MCB9364792.1 pirin family protein [Flavobacteriales bacterium]